MVTDSAGRPDHPAGPIFQLGLGAGAFRRRPRVRRYHLRSRHGFLAAKIATGCHEVVLTDANGQPLLVVDEVEMAVFRSGSGATELTNRLFMLDSHRWKRPPWRLRAPCCYRPRRG